MRNPNLRSDGDRDNCTPWEPARGDGETQGGRGTLPAKPWLQRMGSLDPPGAAEWIGASPSPKPPHPGEGTPSQRGREPTSPLPGGGGCKEEGHRRDMGLPNPQALIPGQPRGMAKAEARAIAR